MERTEREEALVDRRRVGRRDARRAGRGCEARDGRERAEPGVHLRRIGACRRLALLALAWLAGAGCAGPARPGDLAAAALAARGGPLLRYQRASELEVYAGYPGVWHWEIAREAPERLRLTLRTTAETQTLESDGAVVRGFVGSARVSEEPLRASGVAALIHFVELAGLDALADPQRVDWMLAAAELPDGAAHGAVAWFRALPETRFLLGFDAAWQLVSLAGPVSIPGLGDGVLEAHYQDYRRVERWWLPYAIHYRFRGAALLDERVQEWRVGAALAPGFARPPLP